MFQRNIYTDTYSGELAYWQVAGKTPAKNSDFTATLTYYIADRVGSDGNDANAALGTDGLYIMRAVTVNPDQLHEESRKFLEAVRAGKAYLTATPATTTTTTAAPTTTTTTA